MSTFARASSLPSYPDCPRRAATRLLRKEIEAAGYVLHETPQGIGATIGTSVHAAAAYTLTEKANTGSLAPLSAVTDCAIETYRETAREGVLFDQATPSSAGAELTVTKMASACQRVLAPQIDPVAVEERLEADTPYGIVLTGQSDVLARERGTLRDLKTGCKRGNYRAQMGAYSLLMKANGLDVRECREDFLQRGAASKPQIDPVSYPHDLASCEATALATLRMIARDFHLWRQGDEHILPGDPAAFAANPSSMLCNPKYCAAYQTDWCREAINKETE